ncbi:MAG: 3-hydroxybutyrate dehydrogenase [Rhodospirillales bacterium]|nr:3-hydroxybutyrate dehydrogenase [Rhodospirillales bacterium]
MTDLKGKTAVITGSTSGIGLGIAKGMAAAGANIMMNGFGDADKIKTARQSLETHDIKALYHGANMTQPDEIEDLIATAHKEFGSVDILINNAGIQYVAPVEDFPPEKWDAIIAINMSSAFHTIRHALPLMRKSGWGRIINIASAHGLVASPYKSAYVTAKHGILGLTKTIALECAEDNITVNAICPGYVKTPLVEGQIADTAKARGITEDEVINDVLLKAQWTKKFVKIEDLTDLTLFLCSTAAQNMTGGHISIDGGWTAA